MTKIYMGAKIITELSCKSQKKWIVCMRHENITTLSTCVSLLDRDIMRKGGQDLNQNGRYPY